RGMVEPLPATNDTDAPGTLVLVTVTTCVPMVAASVHFTDDCPFASVVEVVALSEPPPITAHPRGPPAPARPPPSRPRTTSDESSAVEMFAAWLFPDTMTSVVGVLGMVDESWQAQRAAAAAAAINVRPFMERARFAAGGENLL